ncbi:ABC transporter ATP-binding protein/permease [bacterium]|nr:ABC transporter ATP-binding protein/permease [bacterium]
MSNYTKETFKIYYQHLLKYKWIALLIVTSVIIGSLGAVIAPWFYKQFFDLLTSDTLIADKIDPLRNILFKVLAVYLITWLFWRLATYYSSYLQAYVMEDLYNTCFAYLHKHSISFFNNNFVGALVKRVNRFRHSFEVISDIFLFDILGIVVTVILFVIVLFNRNIWLGLVILTWAIIYMIINYAFSMYKIKYDLKRAEASSELTGVLADTITNNLNIKIFSAYNRELKLYGKVNSKLRYWLRFSWNLEVLFEAIVALFMIALEIVIFYFAINLWQDGIITIGDSVLIQAYVLTLMMRLWNFGRIIRRYYSHMADAKEMTEILETPHEIQDVKNAKNLKVNQGQIEFNDISFSYCQTRRVINKFNLKIKPQEKVALVGPSGSGKSTIVNLLLRNYDLEKGKILIDGQKINHVTQEGLWKNIALVNQDTILFHRTLKENISYGQPKASDQEIIKAAKLANAHGFISKFPEIYKTYVGERGIKLSGGERQRVAIARAILKNAPILVLDEATSSLDSESEELIQDALANLMKDKTVMVIAHRLSTIMKMDRIIVLDKGKIIEQGTHQELIKKSGGLYKRLWEKQVGGFIG